MAETLADTADRLMVTPGPEGDEMRGEVQRGLDELEGSLRSIDEMFDEYAAEQERISKAAETTLNITARETEEA